MWEGVIARQYGNRYQIAFGHHRVEAARRSALKTVPLILRPLTDEQMLQFMGRENMEDYNADFLCMLETWEAATNSGLCRGAPRQFPQAIDIARILGWTRRRNTRDEDAINNTAAACNAAHALIEGRYMTRGDWWAFGVRFLAHRGAAGWLSGVA